MKVDYPKPWITAGVIAHLRQGWAKLPFQGERGHFWTEDTTTMEPTIAEGGRVRWYTAMCGRVGVTRPRAPAMAPGSWPLCSRCMKAVSKRRLTGPT
jgi:hypothetical protein